MRAAIAHTGGNEVFFLGKTGPELLVEEATVLARGDGESVPAILRKAAAGDVVLHNHPDGLLLPSKADLAVAAEVGNRGAGFYIVDNDVGRIYAAVEPSPKEERASLDATRLRAYVLPGGPVARALGDYEYREEQALMLEGVAAAFNEDRIALIEAGTGTGKSLAYLIPAISWCLLNGERVVVSTNTINLQEQLIGKDLPLLQRLEGLSCRAVLVKGRSNYLCLRKLASAREEGQLLPGMEEGELEELSRWALKTAEGSLADLSVIPRPDIWERVCAEADQCQRIHCLHYGDCFFYKARRQASSADILVVNHHLLMADLAVRSRTEAYDGPAVLPRFHRIIVDEAQHLEEVATEYLGFKISKFGFLKILRRLQSGKDSARGLLPFVAARIRAAAERTGVDGSGEALELVDSTLIPVRHAVESHLESALGRIALEMPEPPGEETGMAGGRMLRVTAEIYGSAFWSRTVLPILRELGEVLAPLSANLKELGTLIGRFPDSLKKPLEAVCIELAAMRGRLTQYLDALAFFVKEEGTCCRWFELLRGRRGERLSFCAAPIDVAEGMRQLIYERFGTVVMTSATLAVAGSFDYFRARVGLGGYGGERVVCRALPSPFDYRRQAFVAAPRGLAEPDSEGFEEMLAWVVAEAARISRGRAFVLFTSYRLLDRLHGRLKARLSELGLSALRQGKENRTALLNRFRREQGAVLFATDSFWEGVDVKGEALQCVILTRLPFRVPSEPIQQARVEAIETAGGDPFFDYSVPQAVIKFRQGFGRLIRHRDDTGAVLILDARVHTRRYGRLFLSSLPEVSLCTLDTAAMLGEMERFFAGLKSPGPAIGQRKGGHRRRTKA